MFYVDLSIPFSPAMVRSYAKSGHVLVYVHPEGKPGASQTVYDCGIPETSVFATAPVDAEPLPQFETPLPQHWQHMLPGPARDAAMAAEGINSHNAQRARRRGVMRHKSVGC